MRARGRTTLAPAAALVLAVLLACGEGEPQSYTRVDGRAPAAVGTGDAVLVAFWATWCGPCRDELPGLLALARRPPASITLVTYGEDEDEAAVRGHFRGAPPRELRLRPE